MVPANLANLTLSSHSSDIHIVASHCLDCIVSCTQAIDTARGTAIDTVRLVPMLKGIVILVSFVQNPGFMTL